MKQSLAWSLGIIIFLIGMGVGYSLTPEYAQMREPEQSMMDLGPADARVDLRYIDGMIAHHMAAIHLLEQVLKESDKEELKAMAQTIIDKDTKGIAQLYVWKKAWYANDSEVTRFTKTNLGTRDAQFDLRFINAFIAHHDDAIAVSGELMTKSSRSEILTLASTVISSLADNKEQLLSWRREWYGL